MPSTYSPSLRIELIANGEQSGTWGSTTNNNLGTLIESAISGYVSVVVTSADQALTALNGVNDESRNMIVNFSSTSTVTGNFNIYIPPAEKLYIFRNNTSYNATVLASTTLNGTTAAGGATVEVPSGKTTIVYCDGVSPNYSVRVATDYLDSSLSINGALGVNGNAFIDGDATITGGVSADSLALTTPLPATSGGTGFNAYVVGTILYGNTTTSLAGLSPGTAGYVLKTNGVGLAPSWGKIDLGTSSVTGYLPVTNIDATGTPSSATFLRGDGTWGTPAGTGGNVNGPVSSTVGAIPTFANTSGDRLQNNSGVTISAGVISATGFSGSGANVTNLSATNISTGTLSLSRGGTGQTTANAALNALLPSQTGNSTKVLGTDGSNTSWVSAASGNVVGPASSTANAVPLFSDTTGKLIKDSAVTYNTTTNTLAATNFSGAGANLTSLSATNISTGTLTVARGGTGAATLTSGAILKGNGTSAISAAVSGTDIKTVNGNSLLGAGDVAIATGLTSVIISPGTGMSGGGTISTSGGSVTLTNAGVTSFNTRTGSVTLSSADVGTATSGLGIGAIGTYALLARTVLSTTPISPGDSLAGSSLYYLGFKRGSNNWDTTNTYAANGDIGPTSPSGTWRAMGQVLDTSNSARGTLFLRIA